MRRFSPFLCCAVAAIGGCVPSPVGTVRDRPVRVSDHVSYTLLDGEESHRQHPETFEIPSADARWNLKAGHLVKLMFDIATPRGTQVERMWVVVKRPGAGRYVGILDNDPACTGEMRHGLEVAFEPRHVIRVHQTTVDVP